MTDRVRKSLADLLKASIDKSVEYCVSHLACSTADTETHTVVHVTGLVDDEYARQATSVYLVGLMADAIDVSMRIKARLSAETGDHVELLKSVGNLVGSTRRPLSQDAVRDTRNPWIAEGISHLCMYVAAIQARQNPRLAGMHPAGQIVGLNRPHVGAKEQGLDNVVLYIRNDYVGLSVVECKAYKDDVNKAISEAVRYFSEIDRGQHDSRIRQITNSMLDQLQSDVRDKASASFWKQHRCYLPNVYYQPDTKWSRKRPAFQKLTVDSQHRVILPIKIPDFDGYFDDISTRMVEFARAMQIEVDKGV